MRPEIGARGRPAACEGDHRREKEEGDMAEACRGRRGTSTGARGRLEVVGCRRLGEATVRGRTVARSGAALSHAMACHWPSGRVRRVWGVRGDASSSSVALDALESQGEREEAGNLVSFGCPAR